MMRKVMWLAALALGLAGAESAHAQTKSSGFSFPSTFNINVTPNIVNNSPMDYRNQNVPIGATITRPNTTGTAFPYTLTSMFYSPSRTNTFSSTTTFGSSTFPTPAQMQAAAPSYFQAFQMYRGQPISR